jgi:hypothetical protein
MLGMVARLLVTCLTMNHSNKTAGQNHNVYIDTATENAGSHTPHSSLELHLVLGTWSHTYTLRTTYSPEPLKRGL